MRGDLRMGEEGQAYSIEGCRKKRHGDNVYTQWLNRWRELEALSWKIRRLRSWSTVLGTARRIRRANGGSIA